MLRLTLASECTRPELGGTSRASLILKFRSVRIDYSGSNCSLPRRSDGISEDSVAKGSKREKQLIEAATKQGWRVAETRDGYQLFAPDGVNIVTIHLTESDARAFRNTIARMRRFGFDDGG
jgi:hypothetical protein